MTHHRAATASLLGVAFSTLVAMGTAHAQSSSHGALVPQSSHGARVPVAQPVFQYVPPPPPPPTKHAVKSAPPRPVVLHASYVVVIDASGNVVRIVSSVRSADASFNQLSRGNARHAIIKRSDQSVVVGTYRISYGYNSRTKRASRTYALIRAAKVPSPAATSEAAVYAPDTPAPVVTADPATELAQMLTLTATTKNPKAETKTFQQTVSIENCNWKWNAHYSYSWGETHDFELAGSFADFDLSTIVQNVSYANHADPLLTLTVLMNIYDPSDRPVLNTITVTTAHTSSSVRVNCAVGDGCPSGITTLSSMFFLVGPDSRKVDIAIRDLQALISECGSGS